MTDELSLYDGLRLIVFTKKKYLEDHEFKKKVDSAWLEYCEKTGAIGENPITRLAESPDPNQGRPILYGEAGGDPEASGARPTPARA